MAATISDTISIGANLMNLVNEIDAVLVSDIIVITCIVFLGTLTKEFLSARKSTVGEYSKELMKLKNYKNFMIIRTIITTIVVFLGLVATMAITNFPLISIFTKSIWVKMLIAYISGMANISLLQSFINVEVKGDTVPNLVDKLIKAKTGVGAIRINDDNESDATIDDTKIE